MLCPIWGEWRAPRASYGAPRALGLGIFLIIWDHNGLGFLDWSNGTETMRNETMYGLMNLGGSEGMTP